MQPAGQQGQFIRSNDERRSKLVIGQESGGVFHVVREVYTATHHSPTVTFMTINKLVDCQQQQCMMPPSLPICRWQHGKRAAWRLWEWAAEGKRGARHHVSENYLHQEGRGVPRGSARSDLRARM